MANNKLIALPCTLSRSGFTDERVFWVKMADESSYAGACPRQYCFAPKGRPIKEDEPERHKSMEGLVLARHVRTEAEDKALVSVPDGGVLLVRADQIRDAPRELSPDVLVQS
jgi:hypothetical protein